LIQRDQPLAVECGFEKQQRLIHAQAIVLRRALQVDEMLLLLGDPLEPVGNQTGVFIL
jgi:hypothetical protein